MAKLTKKKQLTRKLKVIEETKERIADLRDTLRVHVDELQDILDSLEVADECFEVSIREFENGIDHISEYL